MAIVLHGPEDETVMRLKDALDAYEANHPGSHATLYRRNPGAIRVRIIDPAFENIPRVKRDRPVLEFLTQAAGQDPMEEVSVLLLLAPRECETSMMNEEFERPLPSNL